MEKVQKFIAVRNLKIISIFQYENGFVQFYEQNMGLMQFQNILFFARIITATAKVI